MQAKRKGLGQRKAAAAVLVLALVAALTGTLAYASESGLLDEGIASSLGGSSLTTMDSTGSSASGTVSVTSDADYYGTATYTPTETGYYTVASTSSTDDVYICVSKSNGNTVATGTGEGAQATGLLQADTTYTLTFAFYDSDEDDFESVTGSIGYTVSKLTATAVTLDTTYTNRVTQEGSYALYSITVSETGIYKFTTANSVGKSVRARLYNSSWYQQASGSSISVELDAGTNYIATTFYDSETTGRYTFKAHKCANLSGATVATTKSSYDFTGSYIYPDVTVTLSGTTVDEDDYYIDYYSNNCYPGTGTVYVCDYYDNELSATFTIVVPSGLTATAGSSYSVTLGAADITYYSFTPEKTAVYSFSTTGDYDTYGYLYDASFSQLTYNDDSDDGSNMCITYQCTAGTTYYIGLKFYSSSTSGTFTFNVSAGYENIASSLSSSNAQTYATAASANTSYTVELGYEWCAYYSFTPSEAANYLFSVAGDSEEYYLAVYDSSWSRLSRTYGYDDSGITVTCSLEAGATYYVVIRTYEAATFTFSFQQAAQNAASSLSSSNAQTYATAISEGSSYSVDLSSGWYAYYSFTPSETSNYSFTVAGDPEYYVAVYDSSWSRLTRVYNEDDAESVTAACSLEASATYYVVVYSEDSGTFTLSVKKPTSLTGATVSTDKSSYAFTGSSITPDVTVKLSSGTTVSSDEYSVSYSNNFWPGTGKVTVTGNDGTKLKQTFTITDPSSTVTTSGKSVTVAAGKTEVYTFAPTSDGEYQFTVEPSFAVSSYAVYVYDPLEKEYDEGWGSYCGDASSLWTCYQGETYYVGVCNEGSTSATFSVGIAKAVDVTDATVTVAKSSYVFTGSYLTPSVTVKLADGTTASANSYAVSYSSNRYPGTATVTVSGTDDSTVSTSFTITAPKLASATAMAPNQIYKQRISTAGAYKLYSITPSQTYYYYFYVSGTKSARLLLFDSDGTLLDGASSSAYESLEEGKTYYLAVCLYDASATGTYVLYTEGPGDLSYAKVSVANATYTGKALTPAVTVTLDGGTLTENDDYTVTYSKNTAVGKGTVTVTGTGNFSGTQKGTFTISKGANTLTVKAKKVTVKGKTKAGKLKKKVKLAKGKLYKVSKAKGTVTYTRGAVKKGGKKVKGAQLKKIVLNKKTGKITLKKGLKKGTYKVKVKVKAAGNSSYKAKTKTVTVTIKVK